MSTPALNPLVDKIRTMHPGAYDDMDDAALTKAVLAKYPQYEDMARPTSPMPGSPQTQPMMTSGEEEMRKPGGGYSGPGAWPNPETAAKAGGNNTYRAAVGIPLGGAAAVMGGSTALPFLAPLAKTLLPHAKSAIVGTAAYAGTQAVVDGAKKLIPELRNAPGIDYLPFIASLVASRGKEEPAPRNPGAPEPTMPAEIQQSSGLRKGARVAIHPSAALEEIPVSPKATPEPQRPMAAEPAIPKQTSNQLDTMLRNATGAPAPIKPGVPMRQQSASDIAFSKNYPNETMKTPSPDVESTWQKSAGFDQTPAEDVGTKVRAAQPSIPRGVQGQGQSSVVKSFHYDPEAQQMHVTTQSGSTYTHGEVTPEQAAEFQKAPNGQAWNKLRQNSTPVANQYGGGKNINVKPPMKFRSYDPNNLEDILQKSVKQVKGGK